MSRIENKRALHPEPMAGPEPPIGLGTTAAIVAPTAQCPWYQSQTYNSTGSPVCKNDVVKAASEVFMLPGRLGVGIYSMVSGNNNPALGTMLAPVLSLAIWAGAYWFFLGRKQGK